MRIKSINFLIYACCVFWFQGCDATLDHLADLEKDECCKINHSTLESIEINKDMVPLRDINLAGKKINEGMLQEILSRKLNIDCLKNMRSLILDNNPLCSKGFERLAYFLKIETNNLQILSLENIMITDAGMILFAGFFRANCHLTDLNFSHNQITDKGLLTLLNNDIHHTLRTFDISYNKITLEDEKVARALFNESGIERLNISNNPGVSQGGFDNILEHLAQNKTLKIFFMQGFKLDGVYCEMLCKIVSQTSIQILDSSLGHSPESDYRYISKNLDKDFVSILIDPSPFISPDFNFLSCFHVRKLVYLDLSDKVITNEEALRLAGHLDTTLIEFLKFRVDLLTDEFLIHFAYALPRGQITVHILHPDLYLDKSFYPESIMLAADRPFQKRIKNHLLKTRFPHITFRFNSYMQSIF